MPQNLFGKILHIVATLLQLTCFQIAESAIDSSQVPRKLSANIAGQLAASNRPSSKHAANDPERVHQDDSTHSQDFSHLLLLWDK